MFCYLPLEFQSVNSFLRTLDQTEDTICNIIQLFLTCETLRQKFLDVKFAINFSEQLSLQPFVSPIIIIGVTVKSTSKSDTRYIQPREYLLSCVKQSV
jgi:hypothetical protein